MKTKMIFLLAFLGSSMSFAASTVKVISANQIASMINGAAQHPHVKCPLKAQIVDGKLRLSRTDAPKEVISFSVKEEFVIADGFALGSRVGDAWTDVDPKSKSIFYFSEHSLGAVDGVQLFVNFDPQGRIWQANIYSEGLKSNGDTILCNVYFN